MSRFLALSVLYDEVGWGNLTHDIDHIFPRSAFTIKNLKANGIEGDRLEDYQELQHSLANLTLLLSSENQGKSDQPFETWLKSRDKSFKEKHLIPNDPTLYSIKRFEEFIEDRDKLIATRLKSIFG